MRHLGRLILGVLFRLEPGNAVISPAGPVGNRFRMRLSWRGHMYYVLGFYEPELIRTLAQLLQPGDTCLDIGGHAGYLAIIMARLVGPQGRVVAFEPVPENFAALKENIELNGLANVTVECVAMGEKEGSMELICAKDQSLSWTASAAGYSMPAEPVRISVPVLSLDRYLQRHPLRPALLKIDVEGAELLVLQGARETLREIRPLVLVEIHDLGEQHRYEVLALLEDCGYNVIAVDARNREIMCLAVPNPQTDPSPHLVPAIAPAHASPESGLSD
jgi:FkbM family methyltransferase